jgi:hypothetical protein
VFSLSLLVSDLAGDGSRLLRRLARRFMAFERVTRVDESIVAGNDNRASAAFEVEERLLASGIANDGN